MRAEELLDRFHRKPFKPFRIRLADGMTIDVPRQEMLIIGTTRAVVPTRFGKDEDGTRVAEHWRTVELSDIAALTDLGRRKPK